MEKKEPNYKGFCEHLWSLEQAGAPIDRKELTRLARMYNTPIPEREQA